MCQALTFFLLSPNIRWSVWVGFFLVTREQIFGQNVRREHKFVSSFLEREINLLQSCQAHTVSQPVARCTESGDVGFNTSDVCFYKTNPVLKQTNDDFISCLFFKINFFLLLSAFCPNWMWGNNRLSVPILGRSPLYAGSVVVLVVATVLSFFAKLPHQLVHWLCPISAWQPDHTRPAKLLFPQKTRASLPSLRNHYAFLLLLSRSLSLPSYLSLLFVLARSICSKCLAGVWFWTLPSFILSTSLYLVQGQ